MYFWQELFENSLFAYSHFPWKSCHISDSRHFELFERSLLWVSDSAFFQFIKNHSVSLTFILFSIIIFSQISYTNGLPCAKRGRRGEFFSGSGSLPRYDRGSIRLLLRIYFLFNSIELFKYFYNSSKIILYP